MLSEEITKFIGKVGDITIWEVEKGAIRRFADVIDDQNPLYWDEEYARNSRYGSMIAPPGFFGWPTKWPREGPILSEAAAEVKVVLTRAGYGRNLDGGIEYEFFCPIRAGDVLTALPKITDIYEREGKTGKMVFRILETTYTNQNGDLVAKVRQTSISR